MSGKSFTAKDFRTWGATLYAASLFHETDWVEGKTKIKQVVNEVIDQVAEKLGNTRSICKKSYIHPALVDAFIENKKVLKAAKNIESQVIRFLKSVSS